MTHDPPVEVLPPDLTNPRPLGQLLQLLVAVVALPAVPTPAPLIRPPMTLDAEFEVL